MAIKKYLGRAQAMIKRCSREYVLNLIDSNPKWNVLDLGSGADGWTRADVYADIVDYAEKYPDKKFVRTLADETPFKDKEFDFVVATHLAEHVPDPPKFCKELARIGKRGYIEVPTPFFCNIVSGNSNPPPHGHVWWVTYDDDNDKLVFKPRLAVTKEFVTPPDTTLLIPFFSESMVTGIYFENEIELEVGKAIFTYHFGNSDGTVTYDFSGTEQDIVSAGPPPAERWPAWITNREIWEKTQRVVLKRRFDRFIIKEK